MTPAALFSHTLISFGLFPPPLISPAGFSPQSKRGSYSFYHDLLFVSLHSGLMENKYTHSETKKREQA